MERKDVEIEVRIRNNQLRQRRGELGMSQAQIAEAIGVTMSMYSELEGLRNSPVAASGVWKESALKIAAFFGEEPVTIFPLWLYKVERTVLRRKMSRDEAVALMALSPEPAQLPDEATEEIILKERLSDVLKTLTEREAEIIRMRFGLGEYEPMTLEAVGVKFNVQKERIRQIEAKALRKLRHPRRSEDLVDYL